MMQKKGIIFDLDGTLLESMGMWGNIGNRYLLSQGISPPPDLRETLWTMDLAEACVYMVHTFGLSQTPQEAVASIHQMIRDSYRYEIPCKPGASALLDALFAANLPICLATATDREIFMPALERLDIAKYFRFTHSCAEAGQSKRNPRVYLDCADFLRLPPEDLIVVEDTFHAANTAKQAGFTVIGVRDSYAASDWEGLARICDRFVDSLEELLCTKS